jgi:hypothetical protein
MTNMTTKPVAEKKLHVIDTSAEGFLPQKPAEPTADMMRDALDGIITGNFEMVDSRALDLIGRGSQPTEATRLSTFSDLGKAGAKFGSDFQVRTASYEAFRIVEAMDRDLPASSAHRAEAPRLTAAERPVTSKKPKKAKAPVTTGFAMHDFDGPRPKRQPLMDGLLHYAGHYRNVH